MLTATNLSALLEDLRLGYYNEFLKKARRLGGFVKKDWYKHYDQLKDPSIEKNKFTSNKKFRQYLIDELSTKINTSISESKINSGAKTELSNLRLFLMVWANSSLMQESEIEPYKYKKSLDISDRHAVNIALLALLFTLSERNNEYIKQIEISEIYFQKDLHEKDNVGSFKEKTTKNDLINFISEHLNRLEQLVLLRSPDIKKNTSFSEEEFKKKKSEEIIKIGTAISSFITPTKKKKALKYLGIFIAGIASLAAGISTGGAVYLLFPTFVIPAIITGVFVCVVGVIANFRFFSENLPNFLLSLVKKGGATEFINQQGRREQLSRLKKYLLLPIALLASLTVGISGAALTYTAILSFVSSVLPMLAILWPPLPLVIVGILALSVLVVLTVSTFNAIIEMLKTPLSSLKDLRKIFSIENIRKLNARQILSCVIQALLIPVALFGLVYFRITAGVDLSTLTGLVGAIISGVLAFIAQIAFTVLSINKLNNALIHPCDSSPTQT
jgi:hypothetical protein